MSIYIWPEFIRCSTETNELGSDEPYFLVAVVNRSEAPSHHVDLYGPYGDMDEQETRMIPFGAFWGPGGLEAPAPPASQLFIIVALVENDDAAPTNVQTSIWQKLQRVIASTPHVTDRAQLEQLYIQAVRDGMNDPTLGVGDDDVIGAPQVVTFTDAELTASEVVGVPVRKTHHFTGDGGHYIISFVAMNRGQSQWRFCERCRSLFFGDFLVQGICPAGGAHSGARSMYFVPNDHALYIGGEFGWRFCDRCFGLVLPVDDTNLGRCPAGGGHNPTGFRYFPVFDFPVVGPGPGQGQDSWRCCQNCRTMYYAGNVPNQNRCTVGGPHQPGPRNYRLDLQA